MHTALIITNSQLFPSLISGIESFFNTTNFLRVIIQISNKRELEAQPTEPVSLT